MKSFRSWRSRKTLDHSLDATLPARKDDTYEEIVMRSGMSSSTSLAAPPTHATSLPHSSTHTSQTATTTTSTTTTTTAAAFTSAANATNVKLRRMNGGSRRVFVNLPLPKYELRKNGKPKNEFVSNKVRTSRYTVWSFAPKNLFEQFRRAANMYFLAMAILQLIPYFGVDSPALTLLPICVVVAITAIKDGFEDYQRHKVDARYNGNVSYTLIGYQNTNYAPDAELPSSLSRPLWKRLTQKKDNTPAESNQQEQQRGVFGRSFSMDVRVGDFIFLRNGDSCPADALLLSSSDPSGLCFVETKDLDGETNLKPRHGIDDLSHVQSGVECLDDVRLYVEAGPPTPDLYSFEGTVVLVDKNDDGKLIERKKIPIDIDNLVLRGHVVRNTQWAIALVLYTGTESKIIQNSGETPSKRSRIEKDMNRHVIISFIVLFILCLVCAIMAGFQKAQDDNDAGGSLYSRQTESPAFVGFTNFWSALIIFNSIIPISLYVSIEFVKTFQAYFIWSDLDMYDEATDATCVPKSWNLSDDLGQVEYLFSDKTGTLTRNIMEFRECTIGGKRYGNNGFAPETEGARGARLRREKEEQQKSAVFEEDNMSARANLLLPTMDEQQRANNDEDSHDSDHTSDAMAESNTDRIREFFLLLSLCHTVVVDKLDKDGKTQIVYKAESPDEAALVSAAKNAGFTFLSRQNKDLLVDVLGTEYTFELLNVLEFNSTRKRMSVIVRRPQPWNDIVLYCKGADNVIMERLAPSQEAVIRQTQHDIDQYSNDGLRTLMLGYRTLDPETYEKWNAELEAASTAADNRVAKMEAVQDTIEHDLHLLGATGIEDKLQEGVPQCIEDLRHAGIKVWVLTGDKLETAINIGYASNLLDNGMHLWTLKGSGANVNEVTQDIASRPEETHALIIEGSALTHLFDTPELKRSLLQLALMCKSVVCCRVSPLQKALVVEMVRQGQDVVTLAIGDGANDVSMIQAANIGVGITGQEGVQASMAADYAIAQFRFLQKLLLVQGHWNYHRISEMILNFFYKNTMWVLPSLWYQIYSRFSGNLFYDYSFLQLYNVIFTVAPVVVLGASDQDITASYLRRYPQVYQVGIDHKLYTQRRFWLYFSDAIWQSLVVFYAFYFLYDNNDPNPNGHPASMLQFSSAVAITAIVAANLVPGFNTYYWTWFQFFFISLELLVTFLFTLIYGLFPSVDIYGMGNMLFGGGSFWLTFLLAVTVALMPRYLVSFVRQWWFADVMHTVRHIENYEKRQRRKKRRQENKVDEGIVADTQEKEHRWWRGSLF
ncbi:hypothetical protein BCR43DRAFT_479794 [Syncephalastrum racemosum]|uniref:Phospholipid-transporting ATPase n=1 Tax=Syncephalastrum racemosum TaxID=13706 RepID=A0A1X2H1Y0_SYNRA|nr:hypothetical protein BCR43DRAFT_479794 [Syncephalastrum racemosum]